MAVNSTFSEIFWGLTMVMFVSVVVRCNSQDSSLPVDDAFGPPYSPSEEGEETQPEPPVETNTKLPPFGIDTSYSLSKAALTPSPADEVSNFTILDDKGKACIRACFTAVFNIFYRITPRADTHMTRVPVPSKAVASGQCGTPELPAVLSIQWGEGMYNLKFTFENETENGKLSWKARTIQFSYNTNDGQYFNDAAGAGPRTVRTNDDDVFFKTPTRKSRTCSVEDDIELTGVGSDSSGARAILELSQLQIQPYDLPDQSYSEAVPCDKDKVEEGTNVASIAVGATLALIILLVIAGYAVGRRMGAITDKTSYSSMD